MNIIIKRFLAFFLSFTIIFSTTTAFAASPVGWGASPADIIMNGANATITAVKGSGANALQSTIKHAPAAGRIAKHIVKVGGVFAVGMAISQILGDGVDYVLDPANNRVKYVVPADPTPTNTQFLWRNGFGENHLTPNQCIAAMVAGFGGGNREAVNIRKVSPDRIIFDVNLNGSKWVTNQECGRRVNPAYVPDTVPPVEKYIPYTQVGQKIIGNAAAGEPSSQELVKTVAIEDLESGVLDTPLNIAAVPKADAPPVVDPNAPPVDPTAPVPPFDPSSIIAAIKSVMSAVVNMAGILGAKFDALMIEMGLQNAETNRVINDSVDRVIANDNVNVGELVAAIEAIEGNTLTGEVINDAIDRAIAEGKVNTTDIVAAIEAIEGNTLDPQAITDAVDRIIEADKLRDAQAKEYDDARALEAIEADKIAADKVKEDADAKAQADKEFKEWVREDLPPPDEDTALDIPNGDISPVSTDINFGGACPANFEVNSSIFGNPINITLLDTSKFCGFLSTFVKYPVYAVSSLYALYILGGRKDV